MKKIITLALAAVMTLGLTVLPQAGIPEDYSAKETTVKKKETDLKTAKENLENGKKDKTKTLQQIEELEKKVKDAEKELKEAKEALAKLEYTYVTIKDARTKKVLAEDVLVMSGTYSVKELMEITGADKNAEHGWVLAKDASAYVTISGRHTTKVIEVTTKVQIKILPVDEEGRSLGHAFDANVNHLAKEFVTALDVAPHELTFEGKVKEDLGVNGYFVLAEDAAANKEHHYISTYTDGGVMELTAVYRKATAKKYTDKNGKVVKSTKNGQVGKTGEVATVATGIGALMTLAGVVVATKRH